MATILTGAQSRFFRFLLGLAIFMLANSAYLFLSDPGASIPVFYQIMLAVHLVGGTLLLVLATIFLVWHLNRVRKLFRFGAVASGVGITAVAYLLFATGIFIIYEAVARDHFWVFRSHQVLALAAPLFYGIHRWVSHFPPERRATWRGAFALVVLTAAMLGLHAATVPAPPAPVAEADLGPDPYVPFEPRNFPDEASPFFPASTTTDSGQFFPARLLTRDERGDQAAIAADVEKFGFAVETPIGAETCRRCHPDAVAQWEASAHRFSSFNNPFYRASIDKLRESVGKQKSQWCAGCHDPAIMLAGNMTEEIHPLVPESQAGLTCIACHAIERIHGQEGNGNYHIGAEKESPYLFDHASSGWKRWVADQMTKAKPAAHKRMFLKPFFRTAEFCLPCHKVSLDAPLNDYRWLRGQDEYDAWHDSGVSLNAARTFYLPPKARVCQDCHMPPEDAPLGDVAADDGKIRSHRFLAVNTALPFIRGDFDTVKRIEAFLRDGKMRVDVFALQYEDGTMVRALDRSRPVLVPGEEVIFEVVVRNKGVGHTFPGGTNDSNQGWVDFRITGEDGRELYRSGAVRDDGYVDPRAHFYRVVMVRHDGTEADQRDAQFFHVPAFARVIGPGTADVARYGFTVPAGLAGKRVHVEARLQWRKFNRKYTEFVFKERGLKVPDLPHLEGKDVPDLPVTTITADAVDLDVRETRIAPRPVDDPAEWIRYNDHGIANLLQGAFDVAEESFAEVARLQPERPDGWRNQARRWILSGTPHKARPLLEKVDRLAPQDPQRPYFWGRYFERVQEYEQAVAAYRASLEVFPGDRDTWRRLGEACYKLGSYEAALEPYLEVLKIDPEDLQAHKRRLDIYNQLGMEREAAAALAAFNKYKRDDEAQEVKRDFLLRRKDVNDEAQPRHVHR